ncbi:hypothetical protein HDU93_004424 [Gonapodya sp. JEL0774]|nr:hypothetical protein HDU93_004424 [Gonapodya sp. JEL0774]
MPQISRLNFWIPVSDLSVAKSFYESVFGWRVFSFDEKYQDMLLWSTDAKEKTQGRLLTCGGFHKTDTKASVAHPLEESFRLYLCVEDIDAKLLEIENLGGKTVQSKLAIPTDPSGGSNAAFIDPLGTPMYLYQPGSMDMMRRHLGAPGPGDGAMIAHVELPYAPSTGSAGDPTAHMRSFYEKVFGWTWMDMGGYWIWTWGGDRAIAGSPDLTHVTVNGGMWELPKVPSTNGTGGGQAASNIHMHITVNSIEEIEHKIREAGVGGSVVDGFRRGDPKYGVTGLVIDPSGNKVYLTQPATAQTA